MINGFINLHTAMVRVKYYPSEDVIVCIWGISFYKYAIHMYICIYICIYIWNK